MTKEEQQSFLDFKKRIDQSNRSILSSMKSDTDSESQASELGRTITITNPLNNPLQKQDKHEKTKETSRETLSFLYEKIEATTITPVTTYTYGGKLQSDHASQANESMGKGLQDPNLRDSNFSKVSKDDGLITTLEER